MAKSFSEIMQEHINNMNALASTTNKIQSALAITPVSPFKEIPKWEPVIPEIHKISALKSAFPFVCGGEQISTKNYYIQDKTN